MSICSIESAEIGLFGDCIRLRIGDRLYRSDSGCRLQVVVTEPGNPKEPELLLRCSRGSAMKKFYERPAVNKIKLTRDGSAREGRHGSRQ